MLTIMEGIFFYCCAVHLSNLFWLWFVVKRAREDTYRTEEKRWTKKYYS